MGLQAFNDTIGKKDGKSSDYLEQNKRNLDGAERKTCNETHDIRMDSVKQDDCFTPSGRKVVDAIIKSSEKPKVSSDSDLHSDTTMPGENEVTPEPWEKRMAPSAEEGHKRQMDKKVPMAVKRKVFNS